MAHGRFVEERDPEDLGDLGDAVLVDGLHVFCAGIDQEHPDGTRVAYPSVVLSFSGDSMVGDQRTVRIVVPVDQWPVVDRIVDRAVAEEAARAAEPEVDSEVDSEVDDDSEAARDLDADWWQLFTELMEVISVLEPGQFVILSASGNRFVQFIVDEEDAQVETVSNQFLAPEHRLSFEVLDLMEDLGWSMPTHFVSTGPSPAGTSPNHFMVLDEDWDAQDVALVMTHTLRFIHRIEAPADVGYVAGSVHDETILLPTLGLRRLRE